MQLQSEMTHGRNLITAQLNAYDEILLGLYGTCKFLFFFKYTGLPKKYIIMSDLSK